MKYLLLSLLLLTGCGTNYTLTTLSTIQEKKEDLNLQGGFIGGQISVTCKMCKEHPEFFKKGSWGRMKEACKDYENFEAFKAYWNSDRSLTPTVLAPRGK
jgi:hypothetical protein